MQDKTNLDLPQNFGKRMYEMMWEEQLLGSGPIFQPPYMRDEWTEITFSTLVTSRGKNPLT